MPVDGSHVLTLVESPTRTRPLLDDSVQAAVLEAAADASVSGVCQAPFLEALGVALYTTDARGRITFFNQAAAEFWGQQPQIGEEWCGSLRLYWPDGRAMRHDECPMAICLREGRPVRGYQAIVERPDGSRATFVPYPSPLFDEEGRLSGAVNVLVDITERSRAEDELRAAADALRASNGVKDEFLGLVSHELRTPVTTIFGNARLLMQRHASISPETQLSIFADIASDSERLAAVIENLLLLTRLGSGSTLELEPELLGRVVSGAVDGFRRRHPDRPVRMRRFAEHSIVEAERTYLELVLENLLSNADKYSPQGAPIDVSLGSAPGVIRVRILDRGIGIGTATTDELFAPFHRSEEAKVHANGVGIGLTVCRRVIEALGGTIWIQPRRGGGTEVGFALPLATDG